MRLVHRDLTDEELEQLDEKYNGVCGGPRLVAQYLFDHYELTKRQAEELVSAHDDIVQDCLRKGSFLYYVVDRIIEEEGN